MLGNLAALDVGIIVAYLVGCLVVAFWKATEIKNIREYTLGNGSVSTVVLICTIFATYLSASSTVGTVEKIYTVGIFFAIPRIAGVLVWYLMARIYVNVEQFQGCLSISDIMYILYGSIGRWVTTVASVVLSVGIIATQAVAMGYMLDYFLGIGQFAGILVGMGVLTVYSAFGGIRAVALTDVVQFVVFYVAIPTACFFAIRDVGGLSTIYEQLPKTHVTLNLEGKQLWSFLSLFLFILPFNGGSFIQRFLMSNNTKQLASSLKLISFLHLPLLLLICLIGFVIRVKAPDVDPKFVFMVFIDKYLYTGIKGLMIAGMIAVMMSTADSWLNTTSVLCTHDIAKMIFPKLTDAQELLIARLSTTVIGLMAIVIAAKAEGILELYWMIYNFWEPVTLVPVMVGFIGFRTNTASFVISCVLATICTLIGAYIDGEFARISIALGVIGSTVGMFGAHYLQLWWGVRMPKLEEKLLKERQERPYVMPKKPSVFVQVYRGIRDLSFAKILLFTRNQTKRFHPQFEISGIVLVLFCLYPLLVESELAYAQYNPLMELSITGAVLAILLCLCEYCPKEWRARFMPLYWYSVMLLSLPVLSASMLFLNHGNIFYIAHFTLGMLILSIFMDWLSFMIVSCVGVILGVCLSVWVSPAESSVFSYMSLTSCGVFVVSLSVLGYFKSVREDTALKSRMLTGKMAHELRSPLSSAHTGIRMLHKL
ncbi:sodium:solute symporter family protein, partial [Rickettsiales endosymbiont of Peranema trichophorum]|uniref:sodium:solute symporter family protein n=1 Tax=Rickettsiales endosymbiont of Peranema trichophorum TaxID=2486577 RepID=UPI001023E656